MPSFFLHRRPSLELLIFLRGELIPTRLSDGFTGLVGLRRYSATGTKN
jgi:hypothetical protein